MQGRRGRGGRGGKLCPNSKKECAEGRNCVNIVEKGEGEECQSVIPVGSRQGPCLDMKIEIPGHSGSASHPNARRLSWEADEGGGPGGSRAGGK